MTTLIKQLRALMGRLGGFRMVLAMMAVGQAYAGDVHLDVFRFGTETLTNVTVTGKSQTDVYVSHPGGLINVKIRDLDAATLFKLGLGAMPKNYQEEKPVATGVLTVAAKSPPAMGTLLATITDAKNNSRLHLPLPKLPASFLLGAALGGLAIFLFFSYCLKLIVKKSGNEPGFLVWIPVLQIFPMLRAAGMSGWWVVGFCIPGVNLVAHVLWAINLVKVRQKSIWVTIALVLPVINLIGFVYLAFANAGDDSDDGKPFKVVISPISQSAPAVPATPQEA